MRSITPMWPDDDFDTRAPAIASDIAQLLADEPRWVHRRVETVTFNDDASLRRHTSVDFTLPSFIDPKAHDPSGQVVYVPLSLLEKRVLENFDIRDEAGTALPVLPRRQNARVATEVLVQQAQEALRAKGLPDALHEANKASLAALSGETEWDETIDVDVPDAVEQANRIIEDEVALGFIQELGGNFILLVPLRAKPGDHRIVKFAYDGEYFPHPHLRNEPDWGRRRRAIDWCRVKARNALEVLSIASFRTGFAVLAISDAQSYHVELNIPAEVVAEAQLFRFDADAEGRLLAARRGVSRLHLYAGNDHPHDSWAWVSADFFLRPGVIFPVALLSVVTTFTLLGGLLAHFWWNLPKSADTAATLVVALPTFFAPAAAPGTHRLVRRMFKGLRSLVFASALVSFAAAASLALNIRPMALVNTADVWWVLLGLSAAITGATTTSLARSFVRTRRRPADSLSWN